MPDSERLELRVSPEFLVRLDGARGEVPRATWVKRRMDEVLDRLWEPVWSPALEQALDEASRPPGFRGESESAVTTAARVSAQGDNSPASARAPEPEPVEDVPVVPVPAIAKRHWA